jgi:hypothetical protein
VSARPIDVTGVPGLDNATEFLRMWSQPGGPVTCLIDPMVLGPDPMAFGIAIVDAIRHGAIAYARAVGAGEDQCFNRIMEGVMAELGEPTDDPKPMPGGIH